MESKPVDEMAATIPDPRKKSPAEVILFSGGVMWLTFAVIVGIASPFDAGPIAYTLTLLAILAIPFCKLVGLKISFSAMATAIGILLFTIVLMTAFMPSLPQM